MTLEKLYREIGRMLLIQPEAANDPVIDLNANQFGKWFEVEKVVLHDPGEENGYVTLEAE